MGSKKRVLFVDDETALLSSLQKNFSSMRETWEMQFADGGREALMLLDRSPMDVIVTDLLMPDMDGIELLSMVMKEHPNTIRIVLSDEAGRATKIKSVAASHQFVSKPLMPDELKSVILRALALRDLLGSRTLQDLVGRIEALPRLSSLYLELIEEIQSTDCRLSAVGTIISKDIGLTAKILQLVNSAYFSLPTRVSNTQHAARLLGQETLRALVLTYDVFSRFEKTNLKGVCLTELMEHSQKVGSFARLITKNENPEESLVNDAFVAGMLHDVGILVLASNFPKQFAKLRDMAKYATTTIWEAEEETFGASHSEVGAYLLGLWRLPNPVVEAVAFHHQPAKCSHRFFSPLTSVHVADVLEQGEVTGIQKLKAKKIDEDYLNSLGLFEQIQPWREICEKAESEARIGTI